MTDSEIRKAVSRGHGRAILFLRQAANQGYKDLILSLCCRDQAFDKLEEDRGNYMCRLVDTLPRPQELVELLGKRLFEARSRVDRDQVREILGHLRKAGSSEAKEYLLKDLQRVHLRDRQIRHAVDMLGYEGLELLLGQAHRLEDWELSMAYDDAVERFGKRRARKPFVHLGGPRFDVVVNWERNISAPPEDTTTAAEWINRLHVGDFSGVGFRQVATEEDWKVVAKIALATTEETVLREAFLALMRRPWPLEVEPDFQRALTEENEDLRWYRLRMFASTKSEMIRAWAIDQIRDSKGEDHDIAFDLLRLNAKRSDRPLLTKALFDLRRSLNWFHSAGLDVLHLNCGNTNEMLQLIYEHGLCDICRGSAVKALVKRRAITAQQREECLEDSDQFTRKWAKRSMRGVTQRTTNHWDDRG